MAPPAPPATSRRCSMGGGGKRQRGTAVAGAAAAAASWLFVLASSSAPRYALSLSSLSSSSSWRIATTPTSSLPPPLTVPAFDMAAGPLSEEEVEELGMALREVGFIAVGGLGIDEGQVVRAAETCGRLFDLPLQEKEKLVVGEHRLSRGWEMSAEHRDWAREWRKRGDGKGIEEPSSRDGILNERFCIGPASCPEKYRGDSEVEPLFYPKNVFPEEDACPGTRDALQSLYFALEKASERVLSEVARSLDLSPDYFSEMVSNHCSNLQVANYPSQHKRALEYEDRPIRVKAHADSGTITLLLRPREAKPGGGGLEILSKEGVWQRVAPLPPGYILVNVGHTLSFLTGGKYVSTKHKVQNPEPWAEPNRRVSIAYFQKLDPQCLLEPVAGDGSGSGLYCRDLSRVGIMHKFRHLGQAEASRRYHEIIGSPYLYESGK